MVELKFVFSTIKSLLNTIKQSKRASLKLDVGSGRIVKSTPKLQIFPSVILTVSEKD